MPSLTTGNDVVGHLELVMAMCMHALACMTFFGKCWVDEDIILGRQATSDLLVRLHFVP
ncbi:MAG TPA: hypothetical protein VGI40_02765 [Pirellulaceae bacterium]|jgi:hypothetical protein